MAEILYQYRYRLKKNPLGVPGNWVYGKMTYSMAKEMRESGNWEVERVN